MVNWFCYLVILFESNKNLGSKHKLIEFDFLNLKRIKIKDKFDCQ